MIYNHNGDNALFSEGATLKTSLKNPNQYREAVIFESMSHLDPVKIRSFSRSREAKAMIEAGYITYDTLDRLVKTTSAKPTNVTVCHMAKENEDELWNDLVKARAEERRIMNALIEKYHSEAEPYVKNAQTDIIEKCIPKEYRAD